MKYNYKFDSFDMLRIVDGYWRKETLITYYISVVNILETEKISVRMSVRFVIWGSIINDIMQFDPLPPLM